MPPRQDSRLHPFDLSMRPRHSAADDEEDENPLIRQIAEGGQFQSQARLEQGVASNPLPQGGSATNQAVSADQHQLLLSLNLIRFIEQQQQQRQRLAAFRHQPLPMDSLVYPLGQQRLLGVNSLPSLAASDAAIAAIVARRQEINQMISMDANRMEQMIGRDNLLNPSFSAMVDSARDPGRGSIFPISRLAGTPSSLAIQASLLEPSRRISMPNLPLPSNVGQLRQYSFSTSRFARLDMGRPSPLAGGEATDAPPSFAGAKEDQSSSSRESIIASLIERYTSGGTKDASFPLKLHAILANPEYHDYICWLPHGRSWRVVRTAQFSSEVIPRHFRHSSYNSFMRQGKP